MDAEIKAKLEEMANKVDALTLPFAFMTGAQAAWDLAVKAERVRCAKLAASILGVDVSEAILNPPAPEVKE